MAIDLVKQTLKFTFFLGLIGLFVAWAFNLNNSFTTIQYINGQKIYIFNWQNYLNSLTNAWSTTTLNFEDIIPSRTWKEANFDFWNQNDFWGAIVNNIAFVFDWIYFPLNFILYILRWLAWIVKLGLALIGWDMSIVNGEYNSTLVKIMAWITQNLMIPYV